MHDSLQTGTWLCLGWYFPTYVITPRHDQILLFRDRFNDNPTFVPRSIITRFNLSVIAHDHNNNTHAASANPVQWVPFFHYR